MPTRANFKERMFRWCEELSTLHYTATCNITLKIILLESGGADSQGHCRPSSIVAQALLTILGTVTLVLRLSSTKLVFRMELVSRNREPVPLLVLQQRESTLLLQHHMQFLQYKASKGYTLGQIQFSHVTKRMVWYYDDLNCPIKRNRLDQSLQYQL